MNTKNAGAGLSMPQISRRGPYYILQTGLKWLSFIIIFMPLPFCFVSMDSLINMHKILCIAIEFHHTAKVLQSVWLVLES